MKISAGSLVAFGILYFASLLCWASGYEKPSLYSARPAALGGTGLLSGNAAEGLAFNPGLISAGKKGGALSLNFSPTSSQLSGPFSNANEVVTSDRQTSNSAGGMIAYNLNDQWGFAFGRYAVGGGKTDFGDVFFQSFGTLHLYSDIRLSEIALGTGYKINEEWSVGLALRRLTYEASYTRPTRAALGLALAGADFKDLKSESDGYRIGLQYKPSVRLKFGLMYRTPIDIRAEGFIPGGNIRTPLIDLSVAPGSVRMLTLLPQAYALGVAYRWTNAWQTFFEYSFTKYSDIRTVEIESNSSDVGNRSLVQNWKDQSIYKFGIEFTRFRMPLRIGISQTSQVTDADSASPLIYPPTPLQSLSLGTGYRFRAFGNVAQIDVAVDKTTGSAFGGKGRPNIDILEDSRQGNYGIDIFATHLSFIYYFGQPPKELKPDSPGKKSPEPESEVVWND